MQEKSKSIILIGILICLIMIALKPGPSFNNNAPDSPSYASKLVVQLAENRIAIVETEPNSGLSGEVIVLEFNENRKTFDPIGRYNYLDFFRNPEKYNF
ncbi:MULTISPECIES: hypothetical protein [Paenibacillus]|uniref:DUF3139 domain-containing protein n=1 Tax=Paenibacillus campinasensis TaxID=66347 RepID=A0ABW9T5D7_9BACL|nr:MULTISPECIES: hypothetical protein [Paenibacillus]MUG67399.1 hypothetical protein [Paenibacillus campinasensis]PAK54726.1 hypothetical protein CHH75_05975 [Paenibacillus sp. 7541]